VVEKGANGIGTISIFGVSFGYAQDRLFGYAPPNAVHATNL
jgi:hypothetical protein